MFTSWWSNYSDFGKWYCYCSDYSGYSGYVNWVLSKKHYGNH